MELGKIGRLAVLLVALACFFGGGAAARQGMAVTQAAGQEAAAAVTDGAALLSPAELAKLTARIRQVEQAHGVRIGIYVQQSIAGSVGKAANRLLDERFADAPQGGIVLVLAMQGRDWYVATDAAMRKRITDEAGIPHLRERFLPKLKGGDYAGAFTAYVDGVDEMLAYYEAEGEPYDPSRAFSPAALLLAALLAGGVGWLVRSSLIAGMSNVRRETAASAYLVGDSVQLTEQRDTFLFRQVTRTPKKKEASERSGGSARDGGHGGGGGKF